jgi:hypothetical protein
MAKIKIKQFTISKELKDKLKDFYNSTNKEDMFDMLLRANHKIKEQKKCIQAQQDLIDIMEKR